MSTQDTHHSTIDAEPPRSKFFWLGIFLVGLSGVLWFSLFAIPFLPLSIGHKTVVGGAVFGSVQLAWWSGAALVGPSAIQSIKKRIRRRRKSA